MIETTKQKAKIGILTLSDRASAGIYEDISGKAIKETLEQYLITPFECVYRVIGDDLEEIKHNLIELADREFCDLIITTGGTGQHHVM